MPAILKSNRQTIKQADRLMRSDRPSVSGRKAAARTRTPVTLNHILKTATDESGQGKCGFDCLETATRVIEIQFPEMSIAKDMRRLVNEIGRFRDSAAV